MRNFFLYFIVYLENLIGWKISQKSRNPQVGPQTKGVDGDFLPGTALLALSFLARFLAMLQFEEA